jgi:hypothetical protein
MENALYYWFQACLFALVTPPGCVWYLSDWQKAGVAPSVVCAAGLAVLLWNYLAPGAGGRRLRFWHGYVHALPAVLPFVLLVPLYLASWRYAVVRGHWPQPMTDDPNSVSGDALYSALCSGVDPTFALGGAGLLVWGVALLCLGSRGAISVRRVWWLLLFLSLGMVAFQAEPGQRHTWWMD